MHEPGQRHAFVAFSLPIHCYFECQTLQWIPEPPWHTRPQGMRGRGRPILYSIMLFSGIIGG
jgi:hypothetical protein